MPKLDPQTILSVIIWPKGEDYSHEKFLIEKGHLTFDRLGGREKEYIFLTRDAAVDGYTTADKTTHWYRGMPKDEFDDLFKFNIVKATDNSYTGIAPNREYVKKGFFSNQASGTHIVEFGNSLNLSFDEDFSIYRQFHQLGFSIKAEGGGTFGLGDAGSSSTAQSLAVRKYGTEKGRNKEPAKEDLERMKSPSDLFTEWLMKGKIYRKVVDLRLDARSTATALLEL